MSWGIALTLIANGLAVISVVIYMRGVLRKETTPHLFSWIVWTLINAIGFFAQLADGGGIGSWVTGFSMIFTAAVAIYATFYGQKNITRSDMIAFALSFSAIALWLVTHNPLWSVILISIADCLGFYPTFRKSWSRPLEEPIFVYAISALRFALALLALENFTWTTALFPATITVANLAFVVMTAWRRRVIALNSAA